LSFELIRLSDSSLVVSTMIAGEIPFSQIGAVAEIDANFAGGVLVIITTFIGNRLFHLQPAGDSKLRRSQRQICQCHPLQRQFQFRGELNKAP
jgi:hypothetical protein